MSRFLCSCLVYLLLLLNLNLAGQISPASSCNYTLQLFDSAANGWDGAYLDVSINNGPLERYSMTVVQGSQAFYEFDLPNGSIIDMTYSGAANENQHSYILLDALGKQLLSDGPSPTEGDIPTIKVQCPNTCIASEDFFFLLTMGDRPEEMSWELTDGSGGRVAFSNANAYNGFPAGFVLPISMSLSTCEAYKLTVFDGANDGWNGGSFQFISANPQRGSIINAGTYAGFYDILSGPGNFSDEAPFSFTLPCLECEKDQLAITSSLSNPNCILPGFIYPFEDLPTPLICYPNAGHGNPSPVMTISYPTAIPAILNGDVGIAADLPVGDNDVIFSLEYSDGQIIRCTSSVKVVTDVNPTLVCNDNINITLNDIANNGSCEIELRPDMVLEASGNCDGEYQVNIFDNNGINIGNIINPSLAGLVLDYQVQHIASLNSCWGMITVEDKTAPQINCKDYAIACNHPNYLDEHYSYSESFRPDDSTLPANIAGGAVTPSPPSITTLPIAVECGPIGELVQNVSVSLTINHTEIGDLTIELIAPNGMRKKLMNTGTCAQGGAADMTVVFNSQGDLPTIANACMVLENPVINGAFSPIDNITFEDIAFADLDGIWQLVITDNNNTIFGDPVVGLGEVVDASISIDAGFANPVSADDCSQVSIELVSEIVEDTKCNSPWNGAIINRLWKATDTAGNASTCIQVVSLRTPSLGDINLPRDTVLECGATSEVELTGAPKFDCFEIAADQHVICDLTYIYEDTEISNCGISRKIFRDWTIINWCTTVSITHRQLIEISDSEGPTIGVEDIVTGTGPFQCGADLFLNALAEDACSAIEQITASYTIPGPTLGSGEIIVVDITNGALLQDLPIGDTALSINAKDDCGNSTIKLITVTIVDDITPTAVCDDQLRITLSGGGVARLRATDVDEGSVDNCEITSYKVRRLQGCLPNSTFQDFVEFECCDIGLEVNLELLVTDAAGNSAICWLTVNVQDKTAPNITCPSDKSITCDADISDLSIFGDAAAIDNCDATLEESASVDIDNCGAGLITRVFTATDNAGNSRQCTQRIDVTHVSDFTVQFPADVTLTSCSADLSEINKPIIGSDDCELIAISHEDQVFELVADACSKIVRTWSVINWCNYETGDITNTDLGIPLPIPRTYRDDGDGFFQFTQIIKIIDNEAPRFELTSLVDITVEIVDGCTASLNLPEVLALDECSGEISVQPNPRSVSGEHLETVEVTYVASDGCGNANQSSINVTFIERKAPTPVCRSGLVAEIQANIREITIWAIDFETGSSFDNCTPYEDLQFSFSENVNDISKKFTCDQLGINEVEVWVTDALGNQDFCITSIEIQDNLNRCESGVGTGAKAIIGGQIVSEFGEAIMDVDVEISGDQTSNTITDNNGNYSFLDLDIDKNYRVNAAKNNDPLNGVSTFDLVLMARHILQVRLIDNPYKVIACDVDMDRNVSVFDMVALRQLILRAVDELPSGYSWRFIDKNFVFSDPSNPWLDDFEEQVFTENLSMDMMNVDFIGVKLGDVDNSAVVNLNAPSIEARSNQQIDLLVETSSLEEEDKMLMSFHAQEKLQIQGCQFTLNFDADNLEYIGLREGALKIKNNNISTKFIKDGALLLSWNADANIDVEKMELLFSFEFKVASNTEAKNALHFTDNLLSSEIYLNDDIAKYTLSLEHRQNENNFELKQNTPNPFTNVTRVAFTTTNSTSVSISIFDVTGKVVKTQNLISSNGANVLYFNKDDFNGSGVYYLQMIEGLKQSVIKLILIN